MRRAARVDDNQAALVKALRKMGLSVAVMSDAGDGFPDLVVGSCVHGVRKNYLFEVKDPKKKLSARQLTDDQRKFHSTWKGQVNVVETIRDVFDTITEES